MIKFEEKAFYTSPSGQFEFEIVSRSPQYVTVSNGIETKKLKIFPDVKGTETFWFGTLHISAADKSKAKSELKTVMELIDEKIEFYQGQELEHRQYLKNNYPHFGDDNVSEHRLVSFDQGAIAALRTLKMEIEITCHLPRTTSQI